MVEPKFEWDNQKGIKNMMAKLESIQKTVDKSLGDRGEVIGIHVAKDAKDIVRVDTGRLRASIDYDVQTPDEMVVEIYVGSDVYYSIFVEVDYPYLRPAIERNRKTIQRELQATIKEIQ